MLHIELFDCELTAKMVHNSLVLKTEFTYSEIQQINAATYRPNSMAFKRLMFNNGEALVRKAELNAIFQFLLKF